MPPNQPTLANVLAFWVALSEKEDFHLFHILPDSRTPPQPLRHLRRHREGPLPKHAAPACVVTTGVSCFNTEGVNLEWPVVVGNQVQKVTLFHFLLRDRLEERLCFLAASPGTSSSPSSHLPLLGCTSGGGTLPTAQVYCSLADALQGGRLFRPHHVLQPMSPLCKVSEDAQD